MMIMRNNTISVNALKGQFADSPGQHPGKTKRRNNALKGQKLYRQNDAFALSGRSLHTPDTQGVALGYWLVGLSGRLCKA
jgi:hypothetical protein